MKTRIICAAACAVVFLANLASAKTVSRPVRYVGTNAFCWRDGTVMNVSNQVMGVADTTRDGFQPPWTNAAIGFVDPLDQRSYNASTPPAVGYDMTMFYPSNLFYGQVLGLIEGTFTGGGVCTGLYRAFSALFCTQAAYYVDGNVAELDNPAPPATNFYRAYTNNLINPCYSMLVFDVTPRTYYPGAGGSIVSGSVNTTVAGGNNQLSNGVMMIYYRTNAATAWTALANYSIAGNGDFTGTFSGIILDMMAGRTTGPAVLPNSLLGQGPVAPIEGPHQPYVDITNAPATVPNDVLSYAVSGTNNPAVVDGMYVTNLTAGGAAINFPAATPWTAPAIGLNVGANTIVVGGTNYVGNVSTDAVVITRGAVGTGSPFVDITNTDFTVANPTTTAVIGGTNNIQTLVGIRWVSMTGSMTNGLGNFAITGNAWQPTITNLIEGLTNFVTVYGTNAYGTASNDTVRIYREVPAPLVKITNANFSVTYPTTQAVIGGTNNIQVVGNIRWVSMTGSTTNALGSTNIVGYAWQPMITNLIAGMTNFVTATGTNIYGDVAASQVEIYRPTEPLPFVDITNANFTVSYPTTTAVIGGTNNLNTVGFIRWVSMTGSTTNALGRANIVGGVYWQITVTNLIAGATNFVTATGTNMFGTATNDTIQIYRTPQPMPFVDVTNDVQTVPNDVLTFAVAGTNNANLAGGMYVTNATAGGAAINFPATTPWTAPAISLNVGANTIRVVGTNLYTSASTDEVVITRGDVGTGTPFVDLTNAPVTVPNDVLTYTVAGTNNVQVKGGMYVTNETAGGAAVNFNAAEAWTASPIGLNVGANTIRVVGTNLLNASQSDTVVITRGDVGTGTPFVDVTNAPVTVPNDVLTYTVAGTNNVQVKGGMYVTNETAGGAAVNFNAAAIWTASPISLNVGANTIRVVGTNLLNATQSDTVVITRGDVGTGTPVVDLTNEPVTVANAVTTYTVAGTNNAQVKGGMYVTNVTVGGAAINFDAAEAWTASPIGIDVGANTIRVVGTNLLGTAAQDEVVITRETGGGGNPGDVELFDISRVSPEGSGYGEMRLTWSNGTINVLVCTNRYYTTDTAQWFTLTNNVTSPFVDDNAWAFESKYYRIVSGVYTSKVDVGKFDITLYQKSSTWFSDPFIPRGNFADLFGDRLLATLYSQAKYTTIVRQQIYGGAGAFYYYFIDDEYLNGDYATNWFGDAIENLGLTQVDDTIMYNVDLTKTDDSDVEITAVGIVRTGDWQATSIPVTGGTKSWMGLSYPVTIDVRNSGLTNLFDPPQLYSTLNYDQFVAKDATVRRTSYFIDDEYLNGDYATNFFPEAVGDDIFRPGAGTLVSPATMRSGSYNWTCPKPY